METLKRCTAFASNSSLNSMCKHGKTLNEVKDYQIYDNTNAGLNKILMRLT
jgi:hypothetical protein